MCAHRRHPGELLDLLIIAIEAPWQGCGGGAVGGAGTEATGVGEVRENGNELTLMTDPALTQPLAKELISLPFNIIRASPPFSSSITFQNLTQKTPPDQRP